MKLTSNRDLLVKGYSNADISFNAHGNKFAALVDKKVVCGNITLTSDGVINSIENNTFIFTAVDSRGNTITKTVTKQIVDYINLTCNSSTSDYA